MTFPPPLSSRSAAPLVVLALILLFGHKILGCLVPHSNIAETLVFSIVVPPIIYAVFTYASNVLSLRFPGPVPLPLLGNALDLVSRGNLQESIRYLHDKYGRCIDLLLGNDRFLLANDADFAKVAIKSTDRGLLDADYRHNPRKRFLLMEIWGSSDVDLFTRSNAIGGWKARRRILQPAFDQKHVRALQPKLSSSVLKLIDTLSSVSEAKGSFDILPVLQDFALDFILKSSLGVSLDLLNDNSKGRWIIDCMNLQTKLYARYEFDPFMNLRVGLLAAIGLNPLEVKRRKGTARLRSFAKELLEKEKQRQATNSATNTTEEVLHGDVSSLLSIMVASSVVTDNGKRGEASPGLSDDEIMDEIYSFMFAGYDTTSVTLSVLLHHLATNPDAQSKLHEELDLALAAEIPKQGTDSSEKLNLDDFLHAHPLPYLSACIRESQRLQPIAPVLSRRSEQAIELRLQAGKPGCSDGAANDVAGNKMETFTVPKGTHLLIPVFLLHRNASYYESPDDFKPERWLEVDRTRSDQSMCLKPPPTGSFYAFGGGPKMCVGFQLAEKELKMTAFAILASFGVQSSGEMKIKDQFVTGPEAVNINLTRRRHL